MDFAFGELTVSSGINFVAQKKHRMESATKSWMR